MHTPQLNSNFSYVLLDSWYGNCFDLLEFIAEIKDVSFITELYDNRKVQFYHPLERKHISLQVNELVKLFKRIYPTKLKPLRIKDSEGKERLLWTYSFKAKLNDCSVPVKVVVVYGKYHKDDTQDSHVFVSNDTGLSARSLLSQYTLRWGIERIFQELKDVFCFDQYQVRHKTQIERFWFLCLVSWSLVYFLKQNGYLTSIVREDVALASFNTFWSRCCKTCDYKQTLNSLLVFDAHSFLSKNKTLAKEYFPTPFGAGAVKSVKSKRFLKSCASRVK